MKMCMLVVWESEKCVLWSVCMKRIKNKMCLWMKSVCVWKVCMCEKCLCLCVYVKSVCVCVKSMCENFVKKVKKFWNVKILCVKIVCCSTHFSILLTHAFLKSIHITPTFHLCILHTCASKRSLHTETQTHFFTLKHTLHMQSHFSCTHSLHCVARTCYCWLDFQWHHPMNNYVF